MSRAINRLAVLTAVALLAAGGCSDDGDESADQAETTASSPAQTCVDSWNSNANQAHQKTVVAVLSALGAPGDGLRGGTWPESERTVPVWTPEDAFAESSSPASGKGTIATGSCLIVFPPHPDGDPAFFEAEDGWQLVRSDGATSKFPDAARRVIADAKEASADDLGKLKLK